MEVKTYLRPAKNGKSNIYVDYSIAGNRQRKRTKMFLYDKPKNAEEKIHNKDTKKLERIFIADLTLKIQNDELGIRTPRKKIKRPIPLTICLFGGYRKKAFHKVLKLHYEDLQVCKFILC